MEEREYVCTFSSRDSNKYDFAKSFLFVRIMRDFFIIGLPLYLYLFIKAIFFYNIFSIILSAVALGLILFAIFGYQKLFAKLLIRNSKKLYGNKTIENKVAFGEKIVITSGENRTVLEYSSIKKICESGNIYALFLTGASGTYFEKNSCADATDEELLAMLAERTGAKIKGQSKLAIAVTVLATVASTIFSALCLYSIFVSI